MKFLIYSVCLVGFTVTMHAETYCSLVVKVYNPVGREISVPVVVEERDGRRHVNIEEGGTRFCDLGITPVTVTVQDPACDYKVIVPDVELMWGRTKTIPVIYYFGPCGVRKTGPLGCEFLFRFVDSQRKPIRGASIRIQSPREGILEADEFGRVFVFFGGYGHGMEGGFGQELVGTGNASGYSPVELRETCIYEKYIIEKYITMVETK